MIQESVGGASSYQIEVDGNISSLATKNTFTKSGLPLDTEHNLRVRAVRGSSVSGWSGAVKGGHRRNCATEVHGRSVQAMFIRT